LNRGDRKESSAWGGIREVMRVRVWDMASKIKKKAQRAEERGGKKKSNKKQCEQKDEMREQRFLAKEGKMDPSVKKKGEIS